MVVQTLQSYSFMNFPYYDMHILTLPTLSKAMNVQLKKKRRKKENYENTHN